MNIGYTLIPVAITAVQAVASQAVDVVKDGLSFADVLAGTSNDKSDNEPEAISATNGLALGDTLAAGQTQLKVKHDHMRDLLDSLHARLVARFQAAGIDLSEPVMLATDSSGRVLESGGHWDRANVEQVLDADPQLKADLRRLLEQATELAAATPTGRVNDEKADLRLVLDEQQAFFTSRSA